MSSKTTLQKASSKSKKSPEPVAKKQPNDIEPFSGKIGIIGAGALGGYYGAKLFLAGYNVHFLMRSDYKVVRKKGLTVNSVDGNFHIEPPVYQSAREMGVCDLVIVCLKSTDNEALPQLLREVGGPATPVLTLQNGLGNEFYISRILDESISWTGWDEAPPDGSSHVMGGVAFLCSHRGNPGVVHHTKYGLIHLAEYQGPSIQRTRAIGEMFRSAGIPCEVVESLSHARWEKLIWNIPFNGLGVAGSKADTQIVLGDSALRETAVGLMREVVMAALSEGVKLDMGLVMKNIEKTDSMGAYRSSMQIDYEKGRPLEVESILGEPLRRAQKAGIATPRLLMLYGIVKRMDALNRL